MTGPRLTRPHVADPRVARTAILLALVLLIVGLAAMPVRAAATIERKAPDRSWLALGDSYSSGEGIPGTTPLKNCQRATGTTGSGNPSDAKAWAVVAYDQVRDLGFTSQDFVACTGAITDDIDGQIAEVDSSGQRRWNLVTFSFGGNNVKFADILKGCLDLSSGWDLFDLTPGCDINLTTAKRRVDMLTGAITPPSDLHGALTLPKAYDRIAQVVVPGGSVIVAGYPQLVEDVDRWNAWQRYAIGSCQRIHAYDVDLLREMGSSLNQGIREQVEAADARWAGRGVHFVYADFANDVYETDRGRHGLCTGDQWLNGVTTSATSGDFRYQRSFHPTQRGHTESGNYVAQIVRSLPWDVPGRTPTYLYSLADGGSAAGPTGIRRSYSGDGIESSNSTGLWVGCEGVSAISRFALPAGATKLTTSLVLDPALTPTGLSVAATAVGDGETLGTWQLRRGVPVPVVLEVSGVSSLALGLTATSGTCGSSTMGYAVAVDAAVIQGSDDPPPEAGEVIPQKYLGQWSGDVVQFQVSTWTAVVSLTGGSIGSTVGSSAYPTLDCRGSLDLMSVDAASVTVRETITDQGSGRGCLSPVDIVLTPSADGTMQYADPTGRQFQGVLTRQ